MEAAVGWSDCAVLELFDPVADPGSSVLLLRQYRLADRRDQWGRCRLRHPEDWVRSNQAWTAPRSLQSAVSSAAGSGRENRYPWACG